MFKEDYNSATSSIYIKQILPLFCHASNPTLELLENSSDICQGHILQRLQ